MKTPVVSQVEELYLRDQLLEVRSDLCRKYGSDFFKTKCEIFILNYFKNKIANIQKEIKVKIDKSKIHLLFICNSVNSCGNLGKEVAEIIKKENLCSCEIFDVTPYCNKESSNIDIINDDTYGISSQYKQLINDKAVIDKFIWVDAIMGLEEEYDDPSYAAPLKFMKDIYIEHNGGNSYLDCFHFISLDIPSGLNVDNGCAQENTIFYDETVTISPYPLGFFIGNGANYRGNLVFNSELQSKEFCPKKNIKVAEYDNYAYFMSRIKRPPVSNKNDSGRILLLGGNKGMPGAIRIAAEAALRSGAGLVRVGAHPSSLPMISSGRPEIMLTELDEITFKKYKDWADCLIIGPGLGRDEYARKVFESCIDSPIFKVVDADALYFLAKYPRKLINAVITPHDMEAARLLNCDIEYLQANRYNCAIELSKLLNAIVILKGHYSIVAYGDQTCVCRAGCEAMATGGMGDALSGIVGQFVYKFDRFSDAIWAVLVHGKAGEIAALDGCKGTLPSDLMKYIRLLSNGADISSYDEKLREAPFGDHFFEY